MLNIEVYLAQEERNLSYQMVADGRVIEGNDFDVDESDIGREMFRFGEAIGFYLDLHNISRCQIFPGMKYNPDSRNVEETDVPSRMGSVRKGLESQFKGDIK